MELIFGLIFIGLVGVYLYNRKTTQTSTTVVESTPVEEVKVVVEAAPVVVEVEAPATKVRKPRATKAVTKAPAKTPAKKPAVRTAKSKKV
jgi:hypothetical protein